MNEPPYWPPPPGWQPDPGSRWFQAARDRSDAGAPMVLGLTLLALVPLAELVGAFMEGLRETWM
jgi:hypothetical protein